MKKIIVMVFGLILFIGSLPVSSTYAASTMRFTDVPPSKYYAQAVNDLAERNIIGGYPDGTFRPGKSITRGQAAAIIAKMIKVDTSNVKNPGFTDVSTANGSYKAIAALAERGIIGGYGDGRYGPNDPIKRGQMASIIVKAFDLPRFNVSQNPFKDTWYMEAHVQNILILYKLGITSGTTSETYSPNAAITRGQAAQMLKATEEVKKPSMLTMKASDFQWTRILSAKYKVDDGSFEVISVPGKEGYTEDKIQLIPQKEGTGKLIVTGNPTGSTSEKEYKKYYVNTKKVNGELQLTLEETTDIFPMEVNFMEMNFSNHSEKVQNISLSTMDGEKLSDSIPFKQADRNSVSSVSIEIEQSGKYIATLQYESEKVVVYGIDAKRDESSFYHDIKTLKENLSEVYDDGKEYNIGKHKIREKDAVQIAEITRDAGTNLFRVQATGQKEGTIHIDYENRVSETWPDPESANGYHTSYWKGLYVTVKRMGPIVNVSVSRATEPDF